MARSTICADTGNLATVVFTGVLDAAGSPDVAVQAFFDNLKIKRVEFPEESLERIECSHLGTTEHRSYIPSDLTDPPQLNLVANFDTFDELPYVGQNCGTITITFPQRPGETAPADMAGTVYLGARTLPTIANGEIQEINLRIDFDGVTEPNFTPAT